MQLLVKSSQFQCQDLWDEQYIYYLPTFGFNFMVNVGMDRYGKKTGMDPMGYDCSDLHIEVLWFKVEQPPCMSQRITHKRRNSSHRV